MKLQIFDVEHGACALLTCSNGKRLMIDCGHNSTTGWKPGIYLRSQGVKSLDMLAITNYDEDHVSGLPNLLQNIDVQLLLRNATVSTQTLKHIKSKNGMGYGIQSLTNMMTTYTYANGQLPDFSGVELQSFFSPYPTFSDTNNLSMVIHLNILGINFLFTGDLESAGWSHLLKEQTFCDVVTKTHVLIAPHHGRESGIYAEIFEDHGCSPFYVVMSDKCHMHDTQKTVNYYSSKTRGGPFRGQQRRVLTTRNDGQITFYVSESQWYPS
ncbi:ComEC/Rec2 family competence protein [Legionella bozemanae]|uniref:ComEC/Rec2 family competence protein n=1 Tax=Legionella bozemanae TaxID=447 RepID=UPI00104174CF|nr:MBL fold metallo-hydrolase [Legionella bozemanae]